MIVYLRVERDIERRAHKFASLHAESRISELEAQLARREAQLEACVAHAGLCFESSSPLSISSAQRKAANACSSGKMSQEEIVQALDMASAKDKALEIEVKGLIERVRPLSKRSSSTY
jgi:hypothetical protein